MSHSAEELLSLINDAKAVELLTSLVAIPGNDDFPEKPSVVDSIGIVTVHDGPSLAPDEIIAPIVYALPIQMLAYFTAVFMGADVDQPRNLAKSVTVE